MLTIHQITFQEYFMENQDWDLQTLVLCGASCEDSKSCPSTVILLISAVIGQIQCAINAETMQISWKSNGPQNWQSDFSYLVYLEICLSQIESWECKHFFGLSLHFRQSNSDYCATEKCTQKKSTESTQGPNVRRAQKDTRMDSCGWKDEPI